MEPVEEVTVSPGRYRVDVYEPDADGWLRVNLAACN